MRKCVFFLILDIAYFASLTLCHLYGFDVGMASAVMH